MFKMVERGIGFMRRMHHHRGQRQQHIGIVVAKMGAVRHRVRSRPRVERKRRKGVCGTNVGHRCEQQWLGQDTELRATDALHRRDQNVSHDDQAGMCPNLPMVSYKSQ